MSVEPGWELELYKEYMNPDNLTFTKPGVLPTTPNEIYIGETLSVRGYFMLKEWAVKEMNKLMQQDLNQQTNDRNNTRRNQGQSDL